MRYKKYFNASIVPCNEPYNAFYEPMNNVTLHNTYIYIVTPLESSLYYITTDDKQAILDVTYGNFG